MVDPSCVILHTVVSMPFKDINGTLQCLELFVEYSYLKLLK